MEGGQHGGTSVIDRHPFAPGAGKVREPVNVVNFTLRRQRETIVKA